MDRRNDTHLKGRKLDFFCINYIKEYKRGMDLEKNIKNKEIANKKFMYENNALILAKKAFDGLDNGTLVEPCPGCTKCNNNLNCYKITVFK